MKEDGYFYSFTLHSRYKVAKYTYFCVRKLVKYNYICQTCCFHCAGEHMMMLVCMNEFTI